MPRQLEKKIERDIVLELRDHAALTLKLNVLGRRSWPDELVIALNGAITLLEVKREGEEPTPLQAVLHAELARRGRKVHVVRTVEEGLRAYAEEKAEWQDYLDWKAAQKSSSVRTRKRRSGTS